MTARNIPNFADPVGLCDRPGYIHRCFSLRHRELAVAAKRLGDRWIFQAGRPERYAQLPRRISRAGHSLFSSVTRTVLTCAPRRCSTSPRSCARSAKDADRTGALFITVDPERDTPRGDERLSVELRPAFARCDGRSCGSRRGRKSLSRLCQESSRRKWRLQQWITPRWSISWTSKAVSSRLLVLKRRPEDARRRFAALSLGRPESEQVDRLALTRRGNARVRGGHEFCSPAAMLCRPCVFGLFPKIGLPHEFQRGRPGCQ